MPNLKWKEGSLAGPQPITLKDRSDGVKACAIPNENCHLWTIQHEGRNNVSYVDFCCVVPLDF